MPLLSNGRFVRDPYPMLIPAPDISVDDRVEVLRGPGRGLRGKVVLVRGGVPSWLFIVRVEDREELYDESELRLLPRQSLEEEISRDHVAGRSTREIAKERGLSQSAVVRALRRLNQPVRSRKPS